MLQKIVHRILILSFLFTGPALFGQSPDSLHQKLSQAKESRKAEIYLELAKSYIENQLDSSLFYAQKSLDASHKNTKITTIISAHSVIAEVYQKQQKLTEAVKTYLKAIRIAEDNNEKTTLGRLYNGLGICYYYMNNFEKTEYYIKKAADAKLAIKDYTYYTVILSNLAALYIRDHRYDDAFKILFEAEKVLIKENEQRFLPHIYNSLGANYELAYPQSDSAEFYYAKSLKSGLSYNDNLVITSSSHNLGKLYLKQKKYTKALEFLNNAKEYNKNQAPSKYLEGIYATISQAYDSIGDYKNAYLYKKMQFDVNQEIFNVENKKALEELEINYQTQKKEVQIQQQQKEIEQGKNQRNSIIFIAVVVFFIFLFVVLFIFQRRKTRRILEQEKLKLFENIVHEIRTPLTLITGPLERIRKNPDENIDEYIRLMENNSQKLIHLINELLDASKLGKGKYRLSNQTGNIHHFIQNIINGFSVEAGSKQMELRFQQKNDLSLHNFPSNALEKIITNLVGNAVKYCPEKSIIEIKSEVKNNVLYLEINDNGRGIPKNEQKKIFDRFYRGKNNPEQNGTGIGLSLVKELIELLNGEIRFESKLQSGTSFYITIPVKTVSTSPGISEKDIDKPKLLLVEDDDDIAAFSSSVLNDLFTVIRVENGLLASESIRDSIPDIILSDVMMPEKDGIELLQEIKSNELTSHIPVILFSAKTSLESRLQGLVHGADAYIPKPFSPEELKLIVQNLHKTILRNQKEFQASVQSEETFEERMKSKDVYVNKIISLIVKNIEDPTYSVNELSSDMNVSRSQLHRKLTALTGFSTTNFIRMIRLEKARDMLLNNEGNITEIAYACGFNSQSYFTKSFTEHFGKSPSSYMK